MSLFILSVEPFPYESRDLLVAADGEVVAGGDLQFKTISAGPSGMYAAHDLSTDTWGVIDSEGNEVLPFEYGQIKAYAARMELIKGGESTFMDSDGEIHPEKPETAADQTMARLREELTDFFHEACSTFVILKNSREKIFRAYTTEGDLIAEWPYIAFQAGFLILDDLLFTYHGDSRTLKELKVFDASGQEVHHIEAIDGGEELIKIASHFRVKRDGKWGYVTRRLEPATDVTFHNATPMIFSRAFVQTEADGPWKLIDESGDVIQALDSGWAPDYYGDKSNITKFNVHGLIPITSEGQTAVINRDGDLVVPAGANRIFPKTGYISYQNADGLTGVVANDGTPVVPFEYTVAPITPYGDDVYFRVMKDDTWALLDQDGNEVIPPKYGALGYINELGYLYAKDKETGKFGVIDLEENVVVPFEHDKLREDRYGAADGFWTYEHDKAYYNLQTGVSFRVPEDFRSLSTTGPYLNAEFSTVRYGGIGIDRHGDFFEKIDFKWVPLADEKNHTHALDKLVDNLDPKAVKDLFSDVLYWHKSYWDVLEPHLKSEHLPVVEALLKMAAKKPYGADALAGGEAFFIEGLRIVGGFDPDRVEPLAEELLKAGGRKKDRKVKLAAALEAATTLSLQEPKKEIPLRDLAGLWGPVFAHLKKSHGDAADWATLDGLLGDLCAAVEGGELAGALEPFEKALDKIAKKEKTSELKEIRDSVVVLRAWSERRPLMQDGWLNDGASDENLEKLQALYETPLPLSFLVSYRLYDGITSDEPVYMNGGDLLFSPVREILRDYENLQKFATNFVSDPERKETLREHVQTWLPVFNSNGNAWVLNMGTKLPGMGGRPILPGAIFDYHHEDTDLRELRVVYSSFKRLVEALSGTTEL